jgi:hypothetical protein
VCQNLQNSPEGVTMVTKAATSQPAKMENGKVLLNQLSATAVCGITEATMINWRKLTDRGVPPPFRDDGWVEARALGEWVRNHQITRRGKAGYGYPFAPPGWAPISSEPDGGGLDGPSDKSAVDARLKTAQAMKIERENQVAEGLLVPADQVEQVWISILAKVRTRLLKIPSSLAMVVTGDADPHSVQVKLEDAVRDALTELSEDWREGQKTEEEDFDD